ncbi:MOSC domain-containing protein [Bordetella genomosp. 13]|uniref:MOSC domain-containing protein n=1 Tax=Bordetella genomosp. 13 TaxID=463040 RepID=A0A1W6ZC67_9BORD|nr:MOSC N-terminal beta barrel domain-containing protein [Bordetella genomosp. 13]ARP94750.1 MOSC domain-containing protein [Bordetella genomosp. 13]
MSSRLLSLHIYPVKSCAGIDLTEAVLDRAGLAHDRRWMLVDDEGRFMTQRQWPAMALIRTALDGGVLRLTAPGLEPLEVPLDGSELAESVEQVEVWRDTVPARAEHPRASEWLSRFLGRPCRLVKVDEQARRPARSEWVQRWREKHPDLAEPFEGDHVFGFADGFPLLVVNQASLDDLNARLAAQGHAPVPMNRFRPNIVIEGEWGAYEEDYTAMATVGPARIAFVKPCTRCSVPDVDQDSAVQGDQPGRTLAAYRTLEPGVVFGVNAIVAEQQGVRLRVGDPVELELDF